MSAEIDPNCFSEIFRAGRGLESDQVKGAKIRKKLVKPRQGRKDFGLRKRNMKEKTEWLCHTENSEVPAKGHEVVILNPNCVGWLQERRQSCRKPVVHFAVCLIGFAVRLA